MSAVLFAEGGGRCAQILLDVAAQIGRRGETEHVSNLIQCQRLVAQQAADVKRCVTDNPIVGGKAAHLLGHFGQVLGRDAQLVGIVSDLAVLTVIATLQHFQKTLHQLGILGMANKA